MQLTLTIEESPQPELTGRSWRFDTGGATLGRNTDCDLVLPDPRRYTSGVHAVIEFDNDEFRIIDKSTNGTCHNSPHTLIGKNRSISLADGDRIYVGDFVLLVALDEAPDAGDRAGARADAPVPSEAGASDAGHEDPWDIGEVSLPWDTATTDPAERDDGAPADEEAEDLSFSQAPEREHFTPPSINPAGGDAIPDDWDDFLTGFHNTDSSGGPGRASQAPEPSSGDAGKPQPAPKTRDETPRPAQTPRPADPEPPERQGSEQSATDEAATAAPGGARDDEIDEILRVVTRGLMTLLQGRSEIKNEFRIAQTRFSRAENNPLKFSPDPDEALDRILGKVDSGGFLTGGRAFEDAIEDIQAHQLAILSAVQRAIESAVARFDPAELETKLQRISPISAKTPGLRAAKCWNLFTMHYDEVAGRLRDDARRLFLAEFAEAYEEACRAVAEARGGDAVSRTSDSKRSE